MNTASRRAGGTGGGEMKRGGFAQQGFGLLETMAGLIVFAILSLAGVKAFNGVVANHKEAAQVKALTDAVTATAERLSANSVSALTAPGSTYLQWSAPAAIGSGEYFFHYKTVPKPSINGLQDTTVVGLMVEVGPMSQRVFMPTRTFSTLIAPHLSSRDRMGQVSTAAEHAAEAQFYSDLQARIKSTNAGAVNENQLRLNSFSCYDKGQCCNFMERYFKDTTYHPTDGLDEKCDYRCAEAGNFKVKDWNAACGTDFCAIAPWQTKDQCCAAIASGNCKDGSVCASVCIDCLGENGSTCASEVKCDDGWFNDFFDCSHGTLCNGQPLPDYIPDWGNVAAACKTSKCASIPPSCENMTFSCCNGYWQRLAGGLPPWAGAEICATLTTKDQCCGVQANAGYYNFTCTSDGKIANAVYYNKNISFCGAPPGSDWDKYCALDKGCGSTFQTPGAGACNSWGGYPTNDPWIDPDPTSGGVHGFGPSMATPTGTSGGGQQTSTQGGTRDAGIRGGGVNNSNGGRE